MTKTDETRPTIQIEKVERLSYSIDEAAMATGLSTSTLYRMSARKELKVVKIGARTLVRREELERLLRGEPASQDAA